MISSRCSNTCLPKWPCLDVTIFLNFYLYFILFIVDCSTVDVLYWFFYVSIFILFYVGSFYYTYGLPLQLFLRNIDTLTAIFKKYRFINSKIRIEILLASRELSEFFVSFFLLVRQNSIFFENLLKHFLQIAQPFNVMIYYSMILKFNFKL